MKKLILAAMIPFAAIGYAAPKGASPSPGKGTEENKPVSDKVTTPAETTAQDPTNSIKELQNRIRSSQDLTINFVQTTFRELRSRTTTIEGKASFTANKRFRWIVTKPKHYEWICDGEKYFYYDPKAATITAYETSSSKGQELSQIVNIVASFDGLQEKFAVKDLGEKNGSRFLSLEPKSKGELQSIDITFNNKANYVSDMKLNLFKGNYTSFKFSSPNREKVADSFFKLPEKIQVRKAY